MILSYGSEPFQQFKQELIRYHFFADPIDGGADAIFGLERPLMQLVDFFKSAAQGYGTEKRILLLHGPVGSSKSTMARLLKKGLEHYSARPTPASAYTYAWRLPRAGDATRASSTSTARCTRSRCCSSPRGAQDVLDAINEKLPTAEDPPVRRGLPVLPQDHGRPARPVRRRLEQGDGAREGQAADPLGEGPPRHRHVQPKDEKNQDSTELTGDINYRKIAEYGSDSDPRAFNFDGELNVANRGHRRVHRGAEARRRVPVRPARRVAGAHDQAEEVRPDLHRRGDPRPHERAGVQEAPGQRDDGGVPRPHHQDRRALQQRLDDEIKIYLKDFGPERVKGMHIAPHTIEVAAMWAVLTRLAEPEEGGHHQLQKLKLYNGKSIPGFTEDSIKELKEEAPREGMQGISPRYIQDKISNALVSHQAQSRRRSTRSW
jgi:serine protein kinase